MVTRYDNRPLDLYLLLLAHSQSINKREFFVNLETMALSLGMPRSWDDTALRRQVIKSFKKLQNRYRFKSYFSLEELKIAYNAADIVISRAGSGAIYEIAAFEKPAILIPLASAANDHQKINAYIYAKAGAAEVIEESNLKPNLLVVQIKEIIKNTEKKQSMSEAAKNFAKPEAAKMIGEEILKLIRFKPPFEFKKNKEQ